MPILISLRATESVLQGFELKLCYLGPPGFKPSVRKRWREIVRIGSMTQHKGQALCWFGSGSSETERSLLRLLRSFRAACWVELLAAKIRSSMR